ncbi:MAG: 50S ribosomal protein L4 [bacterium]|nr:50S ribosomal protein L4 [bacterium]
MAAKSKSRPKTIEHKQSLALRARTKAKKVGLTVPVHTKSGLKNGTISLPTALFGQKPNKVLIAQAMRVFLSNQRSAHAKTQTRGELGRSTRKIYKQKGTGGARHGSRSAPIFVGGGIAHGPHGIQNYKLAFPKKMARLALISALSKKFSEDKIRVADIEKIEPKTKAIMSVFKKIGLTGKKTVVHAGSTAIVRAGRNIKDTILVPAQNLNAYEIFTGGVLLFTKDAVVALETRMKDKGKEKK